MVEEEINEDFTQDDREDLRAAYQALPQMIAKEGQKQWSATSVFIQFSLVVIAAALVPAIIPGFNERSSAILGLILSFLGFIASFIWFALILRFEKIVLYWILSVREVEELMSKHMKAFQRGKDFAAGDSVEVSSKKIQYKGLERLPERWGLPAIYIAFVLIYGALIILNIARLCSPANLVAG
jgi:hypothetical protein